MICPYCNNEETKVTDKRDIEGETKRRRECLKCNERFTTYERV
jgi:transcriptional repressor NrdR